MIRPLSLSCVLLAACLAACEAGQIWLDASTGEDGAADGAWDGGGDGADGADGDLTDGGDGCENNCSNPGQRQCLDEGATWECVQDGDCLHWTNPDSCPANESCVDGACLCFYTTCGENCCTPEQTCTQGICCQAQCEARDCGPDGCGGECGICGAGETCADGLCQPSSSCDTVQCAAKEWCLDGVCRCQSGWERQGADCQAIVPPDPTLATRSEQQVCDKWRQDVSTRATWVFQAGADSCDLGTLNPESIDDGVRRINLFRWLVGLQPAYNLRSLNEYAQPCAIMLQANGQLNHSPPASWNCYSAAGASGAGHSNLAQGTSDPAASVSLFVQDPNVASLGHRRWILDPPYQQAGIGQAGAWNCTYVMTSGNDYTPSYVAYPAPGAFPSQALLGPWSLGASAFDAGTLTLTVEALSSGEQQEPAWSIPGGGYGSLAYLSFQPADVSVGESYLVTVSGVRLVGGSAYETLSYTVEVVNCN